LKLLAGLITRAGVLRKQLRGLKFFRSAHVLLIARVVAVGVVVQCVNVVLQEALISVLNVRIFHVKEIGVKKANMQMFLQLIYLQPSSGALFNKDKKFAVEKISIWEGSFQKASGKYRAMAVWVSKKEHLPGIKKLIDRIPISQ